MSGDVGGSSKLMCGENTWPCRSPVRYSRPPRPAVSLPRLQAGRGHLFERWGRGDGGEEGPDGARRARSGVTCHDILAAWKVRWRRWGTESSANHGLRHRQMALAPHRTPRLLLGHLWPMTRLRGGRGGERGRSWGGVEAWRGRRGLGDGHGEAWAHRSRRCRALRLVEVLALAPGHAYIQSVGFGRRSGSVGG